MRSAESLSASLNVNVMQGKKRSWSERSMRTVVEEKSVVRLRSQRALYITSMRRAVRRPHEYDSASRPSVKDAARALRLAQFGGLM
eukprot:4735962-Heterocapsa_arctica.AAC.1